MAYYENTPLAAMFLVLSSHRATYLYGASSSSMRNVMPTYALQWKAIQEAKAGKCYEYDMFGIAPNPNPSTRCTVSTSSRTASAARYSTNSDAGTTPSTRTSTTASQPAR